MTKPVFDIMPESSPQEEFVNHILLVEVSEKLFGYLLFNKEAHQFLGLRQYHLNVSVERPTSMALNEIIANDTLLNQPWNNAVVIYNFPDSTLLPEKFFDIGMNKSIMELVHGNAFRGLVLSEKVQSWEVYNIYRVQRDIHALLQQKFSGGKYWHYYSMFLCSLEQPPEEDTIKIVFYPEKFIVAFFRNRKLQILQTYNYEIPEDVAYYLLAISTQFDISRDTVRFYVSGLIEQQSSLFAELLKYFTRVEWDEVPSSYDAKGLLQSFPSHYFSHLLKMASCV